MNNVDEVTDWLKDAYAMERALEVSLRKQSKSEDLPAAFRLKAKEHLAETQRHAELIEQCLGSLDADTSTVKTGVAKTLEGLKGFGTMMAGDETIKDGLDAYAAEHFEIACYKALRKAGELIGNRQIVRVCDTILPDEERMAQWLDAHLPELIEHHLTAAPSGR